MSGPLQPLLGISRETTGNLETGEISPISRPGPARRVRKSFYGKQKKIRLYPRRDETWLALPERQVGRGRFVILAVHAKEARVHQLNIFENDTEEFTRYYYCWYPPPPGGQGIHRRTNKKQDGERERRKKKRGVEWGNAAT